MFPTAVRPFRTSYRKIILRRYRLTKRNPPSSAARVSRKFNFSKTGSFGLIPDRPGEERLGRRDHTVVDSTVPGHKPAGGRSSTLLLPTRTRHSSFFRKLVAYKQRPRQSEVAPHLPRASYSTEGLPFFINLPRPQQPFPSFYLFSVPSVLIFLCLLLYPRQTISQQ